MHGEVMERIRENLCEFLEHNGMDRIDNRNIEPIYMASVAYEKLIKAEVLEKEMGGWHSRDGGYSSRRGYSRDGMPYDEGGDSYSRDSMGRYSRADGKQHMKEQVEILMRQAGTPQEKEIARKFMEMLDKT